jgi:ribosome-associated heat shock protein Hsp15
MSGSFFYNVTYNNMSTETQVRIDKWLWAVRLFKTRSLATDACKSGKVKLEGRTIKPSHEVKTGEVYTFSSNQLTRTVRVKALLQNRVSAKLAPEYLEDLTPAEEYQKLETMKMMRQGIRPAGFGRPTKKDRREMDNFLD